MKEQPMRTTTMALLCSLAAAGCAPLGNPGAGDYDVGPDAGVDGGAATSGTCDELVEKTMDLTITGTAAFSTLPTTCWRLRGKLTLRGPAVTSVAKLGDLRGVTDLEIDDTDLVSIDTRGRIDVTGAIYIHHNDQLTDLANIAPKSTVRSLRVELNNALTGLGGLSQAMIVSGTTSIANNSKLAEVNLGAQRLEGGLTIRDNLALSTIRLDALQSSGAITIANNGALKTLAVSTLLKNVHGSLTIDNNDALTSLGNLGNGVIVGTSLAITGNAVLADVGQLDRAAQVFGTVQIANNAQLHPTRAHDLGCCVPTSGFVSSNNRNATCSGTHWCLQFRDCYR
jgi:hypothetical protein